MAQVFIVHHNPNNGVYRYAADPADAIGSATALLANGESDWVAGNYWRRLQAGDRLFFKFGGARLRQAPGIYAAASVTRAPVQNAGGTWLFRYQPDAFLTQKLLSSPIIGRDFARIVDRSYGASIQLVEEKGRRALEALLGNASTTEAQAITHGLLILKGPLDKILAGTKTWEIRGKATARRGPIALIKSKSGHVVGTCEIVDVNNETRDEQTPVCAADLSARASLEHELSA